MGCFGCFRKSVSGGAGVWMRLIESGGGLAMEIRKVTMHSYNHKMQPEYNLEISTGFWREIDIPHVFQMVRLKIEVNST